MTRKPLAPWRWLMAYPEWAAIGLMAGALAGLLTAFAWRA
jgi:hypothetical protein